MLFCNKKFFQEMVVKSWWVFLFGILCAIFYLHGREKQEHFLSELSQRIDVLENQKQLALMQQQEYLLQIDSQKDPAWIEMVLKRKLGLAAEGEQKVYFEKEDK